MGAMSGADFGHAVAEFFDGINGMKEGRPNFARRTEEATAED